MSLVANIQGLGKYVAYYPNLNHITGNVLASILLHELIFQTQYQTDPAGVSIKEIKLMELTGFSQKELRSARARLASKGLTVETAKGLPKRNFYRVNSEVVDSLWSEYQCTHLSAVSLAREEKKNRLQSVLSGLTGEDASVSPIRTHQSVLSGRTGESCQDASSESCQDALSYTSLKSLDKSLDKSLEEKDSRALESESESVPIADEPEKGESQNFVLCLEIEEEGKVKTGGRNSKKKSSAAAPPKNSTSKPAALPNLSDADCDRFVAAWNEAKPAHFVGMLALTDSKLGKSRKAIFESMVKEAQNVDIAIAALQHYLRTSATDYYWHKDGFEPKIENLASKNKLAASVQAYRIKLQTSQHSSPADLSLAQSPSELAATDQEFDSWWNRYLAIVSEINDIPCQGDRNQALNAYKKLLMAGCTEEMLSRSLKAYYDQSKERWLRGKQVFMTSAAKFLENDTWKVAIAKDEVKAPTQAEQGNTAWADRLRAKHGAVAL